MDSTTPESKKLPKRVVVCAYGAKLMGGQAADGLALSVLRAQNRLWNALVEVERESRVAYRSALAQSDPELGELTAVSESEQLQMEALLEARNKERARDRTKKTENATKYSLLIKESAARLKVLRAKMKECRVRAKEAAKPILEANELARREKVKAVAKAAGLWWAHSESVLAKFDVARVRAMKEGAELNFHRFDGNGSFGVRFTGDGGNLVKIYAGDTKLLQFRDPLPEELGRALAVKADGGRRVVTTIRAGDKHQEGGIPFLEFMVNMHAGMVMPGDVPLKTVTLSRTVHVNKAEWKIVFTFSTESDAAQELPELPSKAAGVDFGFRIVQDGGAKALRVAAVSLGDKVQYVTLGSDWLMRMERADRLRGELDASANIFAQQLLPKLTDEALAALDDSEWFKVIAGKAKRAKGAYVSLLTSVCDAHEKAGSPLGSEMNEFMQTWSRHATKLALEAHHCRRKAVDNRKHVYRNAAATLVASAGLIGIEDVDLRELAVLSKEDGTENELHQLARKYRTWASPSELRLAIEQAAKREKREVVKVDPKDTSRICSACGHVHQEAMMDLTFVCAGCGKVHDQDENAAINGSSGESVGRF